MYAWARPGWPGWPVMVAPFGLVLLALLVALADLDRPVRRRFLAMLAPPALVGLLESAAGLALGPIQYGYLGRGSGSAPWLAPVESLGLPLLALGELPGGCANGTPGSPGRGSSDGS